MSQVEDPKSSVDSYELPCGYLDPEGKLHTDAEVREMTGDEEEILAAKNMPVGKKFNKILARCVTRIGGINNPFEIEKVIPELTQGDRIFLLFCIRRVTLGDDMPFISKCPGCDRESQLTIDLSELEIIKMPDPTSRVYEETLPKSGKKIRMVVLTGRGEDIIGKAASAGKDVISTAILARTESMDGKPVTLADLKALPLADRNFLRDVWEDHEGGVETDVDVQCPGCDNEYQTGVELGSQGFFNPSGALKSWKKKSST